MQGMSPTLKCGEKRLTLYSLHVLAMFQHIQVISHVLPMINQRIMCNLEAQWPEEFEQTSSHNFCTSDDMQIPMADFYFT